MKIYTTKEVTAEFYDSSIKRFYDFFFEAKTNKFIIPVYQRYYTWGEDELSLFWDALFIDKEDVKNGDKEEVVFLGNVILAEKETRKNEETNTWVNFFEIVDGQQRITSTLLIFSVFYDLAYELDMFYSGSTKDRKVLYQIMGQVQDYFELALDDELKFETEDPNSRSRQLFEMFRNINSKNCTIGSVLEEINNKKNVVSEDAKKLLAGYKYLYSKLLDQLYENQNFQDILAINDSLPSSVMKDRFEYNDLKTLLKEPESLKLLIKRYFMEKYFYSLGLLKDEPKMEIEYAGSDGKYQKKIDEFMNQLFEASNNLDNGSKLLDEDFGESVVKLLQVLLNGSEKLSEVTLIKRDENDVWNALMLKYQEEIGRLKNGLMRMFLSVLIVKEKDGANSGLAMDIYESVNSYSKRLETSDLVKKRLSYISNGKDNIWAEVVKNFPTGGKELKTFMQYAWMAFSGRYKGEAVLYKDIRKEISNDEAKDKAFSESLVRMSSLFAMCKTDSADLNSLVDRTKEQMGMRVNVPIAVLDDKWEKIWDGKKIGKGTDEEFIHEIVKKIFSNLYGFKGVNSGQWVMWYMLALDTLFDTMFNGAKIDSTTKKQINEVLELQKEVLKLSWIYLDVKGVKANKYLPYCKKVCEDYYTENTINGKKNIESLIKALDLKAAGLYREISGKTTEDLAKFPKAERVLSNFGDNIESALKTFKYSNRHNGIIKHIFFELDPLIKLELFKELQLDHLFPQNPEQKDLDEYKIESDHYKTSVVTFKPALKNGKKSPVRINSLGNLSLMYNSKNAGKNRKWPTKETVRAEYFDPVKSSVKSLGTISSELAGLEAKFQAPKTNNQAEWEKFIDARTKNVVDLILTGYFGF